jgi:hypothetical protein
VLLRQYKAIVPKPGWTVLDIGCSIGDYAYWATRKGSRVIAYECDRFCYPALRRNAKRFGFEVVEMRITNLLSLPDADLIKVDIEGAEYDLQGWARYPRVIMEYHEPYGDSRLQEAGFRDWGYQVVRSPNRHRADIGILAAWRPGSR